MKFFATPFIVRQHRNVALWLVALTSLCAWRGSASSGHAAREYVRHEASHYAMGCTFSLIVDGDEQADTAATLRAAFAEIDRLDALLSNYKTDSALSQLNRTAAQQAVSVEPELFALIAKSLRYSRLSRGAFDITVGPLMRAWGFFRGEGRLPTARELVQARASIGYQHILLDHKKHTIRFAKPGIELDLGGIGKGYAVDRVVALLKQRGVKNALVNACGSTIYGLGNDRMLGFDKGWAVQVRDPLNENKVARTVHLKDQALSLAGSYEKFFEVAGRRYAHIMNPRTGRPVQGVLSVAVITTTGTAGDALDNVFYVGGIKRAQQWQRHRADVAQVLFFLPDDKRGWRLVLVIPGLLQSRNSTGCLTRPGK